MKREGESGEREDMVTATLARSLGLSSTRGPV